MKFVRSKKVQLFGVMFSLPALLFVGAIWQWGQSEAHSGIPLTPQHDIKESGITPINSVTESQVTEQSYQYERKFVGNFDQEQATYITEPFFKPIQTTMMPVFANAHHNRITLQRPPHKEEYRQWRARLTKVADEIDRLLLEIEL